MATSCAPASACTIHAATALPPPGGESERWTIRSTRIAVAEALRVDTLAHGPDDRAPACTNRAVENCSLIAASISRSRSCSAALASVLPRSSATASSSDVVHQRRLVADDLHLSAAARHPHDRRRRAPVRPAPCRSVLRACRGCRSDATPSARAPRRGVRLSRNSIHEPERRGQRRQSIRSSARACRSEVPTIVSVRSGCVLAHAREDAHQRARIPSPERCGRWRETPSRRSAHGRPRQRIDDRRI